MTTTHKDATVATLQTIKISSDAIETIRRVGLEASLRSKSGRRVSHTDVVTAALAVAAAHSDEFNAAIERVASQ